jgi:hypothetical protein
VARHPTEAFPTSGHGHPTHRPSNSHATCIAERNRNAITILV